MAAKQPRTELGAVRFAAYADEAGFGDALRAVARAHFVTIGDTWLDHRGESIQAARMEVWWTLVNVFSRSEVEVARMYARDKSSIQFALQRLEAQAASEGVVLDESTVRGLATRSAAAKAASLRESGARVGFTGRGVARRRELGQLPDDPKVMVGRAERDTLGEPEVDDD